jgi:hypothetical protein
MSKKTKSKKVLLAVFLAAVLGIFAITFWYLSRPKKTANLEVNETIKKSGEQTAVETAKGGENKNSNQNQQSIPIATSPVVNITSAAQQNSVVVISALVGGVTSGSCNITLSNGPDKVKKSAPVGFQISYYICQGFTINSSEFNPKGEWTAIIDLTSPNGTAQSEPIKVKIQ